jgi:hypothetical protein
MSENEEYVPLIWHMFDPELTDEQLTAALASIGVGVVSIDREKCIVWVDKGNEVTPEIQDVLEALVVLERRTAALIAPPL